MTDPLECLSKNLPARAKGVEIGAHALPTPGLTPLYLDCVAEYAGAAGLIDVQANALALPFPDAELDYLCASHVLEHLPNPLAALLEWRRVLKPGGLLYLTVPDQRFTFDAARPTTTAAHLLEDFRRNTATADRAHIEEFIYQTNWERLRPGTSPAEKKQQQEFFFEAYVKDSAAGKTIDIHYHTFTPTSVISFLTEARLINHRSSPFEVLAEAERYPPQRGDGFSLVLRQRERENWRTRATFAFPHPRGAADDFALVCPETLAPLRVATNDSGEKCLVSRRGRTYAFLGDVPLLMLADTARSNRPWSRRLWRTFYLFAASLRSAGNSTPSRAT